MNENEPLNKGLRRAIALQVLAHQEEAAHGAGNAAVMCFVQGFRAALVWENKIDQINAYVKEAEAEAQARDLAVLKARSAESIAPREEDVEPTPAARLGPTQKGGRRQGLRHKPNTAKIVDAFEQAVERRKAWKNMRTTAPASQSAEVNPEKIPKIKHTFTPGSLESRVLAYLQDKGPTPYKTLRFELNAADAELDRACKTLLEAGKASKKYTTYEAIE
ncbi:hypothetical protein HYV43_01880 [Candidatus Micrarchaeota archaeon]|nr:hypothetical protein [Candidatus Micrarchaeota archaeon]